MVTFIIQECEDEQRKYYRIWYDDAVLTLGDTEVTFNSNEEAKAYLDSLNIFDREYKVKYE